MSVNTYFCSCMGYSCRCADRLDREILSALREADAPLRAHEIADWTGVDSRTIREALADLVDMRRVARDDATGAYSAVYS